MTQNEFHMLMSGGVDEIQTENSSAIATLERYTFVQIILKEENNEFNYYYSASIDDLIENDITEDDVIEVREHGWKIDTETNNIIKLIN